MLGRWLLLLLLLCTGAAWAAEVTDATGRAVQMPDQMARVLPAGPPAAVLLAAIAPDLMLGWPSPLPDSARALLPARRRNCRSIPRLTGRDDVTEKIKALKPDLILDYGTVSPRYFDLAQATQQKTGIPTILLDGALADIPHVMRTARRHPAPRGPRRDPGDLRRGVAGAAADAGASDALYMRAAPTG